MVMKGFLARALFSWMARATSSFPVPLSPVISTRLDCGAMFSISSKMARIFGAGADHVVEPRKPPQFAAQIARFLLQRQVLSHLLHGGTQFVEQAIALDDVAVRAEIHRVDGRVDGGHAGDQEKVVAGETSLQ